MCLWYFRRLKTSGDWQAFCQLTAFAATEAWGVLPLSAPMRTTPTVTPSNWADFAIYNGSTYVAPTGLVRSLPNAINNVLLDISVSSGLTAGAAYLLVNAASKTPYLDLNSEL